MTATTTTTTTEVRAWLERVYADAPGLLSVVHMDAGGTFHGTGGTVDSIDAAAARAAELDAAGAQGVYLRTTTLARPLGPHERGSAADSLALPGLWADVDFGELGHKPGKGLPLPPDAAEAWRIVAESGLPAPSLWVHSGGGLYPHWLFPAPLVLDGTNRDRAAELSAQWQQALKRSADRLGYEYGAGVGDLARVLRMPGTTNRKGGQERPCRVVEDTGAAYTLEELAGALAAVTPPPPAPEPPRAVPVRDVLGTLAPGRSAFDLLDEHVTFDELLTGAGWTRHRKSHAQAVEHCWTRPGDPDNPCSAHTLTAQPAVLVVHSELAGLPTGGGQKLTRGRLFAHLWHNGDERAAALDLFAAIGGRTCTPAAAALPLPRQASALAVTSTPAAAPAPEVAAAAVEHEAFWSARPELEHVRAFARARRASPWAVLGCVLARVVAQVEPWAVLPPTVGGHASLNLFLGLVGPSGGGKGAAEAAARDALDYGDTLNPLTVAGVGSGEGIAHTYLRYVAGKGGQRGKVEQHTTRALFRAPEVDTLAALKGRQGSTLLPKLRDAWNGDALGFAYADVTRRLDLAAHAYRLCLVVGIQPARAFVLLDDADGGTPQRFLWLPVLDPGMPDLRPDEPTPMPWHVPSIRRDRPGRHVLPVCEAATDAVDRAALARNRGEVDALDGHALLARLKAAAALGLLFGRAEVTGEDWTLAGQLMAVSDATRAGIVRQLGDSRAAVEAARGRADGMRALAAEEVREEATVQRVRRTLLRKMGSGWTTRGTLRKALASRDRPYFDQALDALVDAGLVEAQDVAGTGQPGAEYRLIGGAS